VNLDHTDRSAAARWEHFIHVADVGVRGFGETMAQAFEQAALALTAVITEPGSVAPRQVVEMTCEAPDPEILLADWLNALIFEMATRGMLFGDWQVTLHDRALDAVARGERVDRIRHEPVVEVKGATYTALAVSRDDAGTWHAQCVVDV